MQEGNAIRYKYEMRCKHNLVAMGEVIMDIGKMVDKAVA
jgi:Cu/Ag efflux pump CusA